MKGILLIHSIIFMNVEAFTVDSTQPTLIDQLSKKNKRSPDSFGLQRTINYQIDSPNGQFHFENRDSNGHVYGCYGLRSSSGNTFYISDENGYRVLTKIKAITSLKADFFPVECFPDNTESNKLEKSFVAHSSNLLQLDSNLLQNSVLVQQPTAIKTKMMMKKGPNGQGEVPVMVVLVPFCPNQHKTQFPPIAGVVPAKSTTFRIESEHKNE